jgi:hypothetical protein
MERCGFMRGLIVVALVFLCGILSASAQERRIGLPSPRLTTDPVKARCIQKKVQQAQRQRHPGFTALVEAASRNEMTPRVSAIWATKLAASCGTSIP